MYIIVNNLGVNSVAWLAATCSYKLHLEIGTKGLSYYEKKDFAVAIELGGL